VVTERVALVPLGNVDGPGGRRRFGIGAEFDEGEIFGGVFRVGLQFAGNVRAIDQEREGSPRANVPDDVLARQNESGGDEYAGTEESIAQGDSGDVRGRVRHLSEFASSERKAQANERVREGTWHYAYALKCDVRKVFWFDRHAILNAQLARTVECGPTLDLVARIVASLNPDGENVIRDFPGDDLFSPYEQRRPALSQHTRRLLQCGRTTLESRCEPSYRRK